jgi:hypothetical protein
MDQVTIALRPTRARKANGPVDPLKAASLSFSNPQEVLAYPLLDTSAKRAILAAWASDACAVENLPDWRKLPETGALVPLDDILDALQGLDGSALH